MGFENAGCSVVAAYEKYRMAIELYKKNISDEINELDLSTGRCGYYLMYFTNDGYGISFQLCYEPGRGDS